MLTNTQARIRVAVACIAVAAAERRLNNPERAEYCVRLAHTALAMPEPRPAPDPEAGLSRASGDWPAGWWLMLVPLGLVLWAAMLWGIARLVAS